MRWKKSEIISPSQQSQAPVGMFTITTREDPSGRVMVLGKASRKHANTFLNIPVCQATKARLDKQLVGSLSMGTSALLQWALEELERQGVSIEARLKA